MIAVAEFAQGAMENWGLITYRDTILQYDPQTTMAKALDATAKVSSKKAGIGIVKVRSSLTSSRINGLAIWSQWNGGMNCG